jgi:hypothetical protein
MGAVFKQIFQIDGLLAGVIDGYDLNDVETE